MAQNQHKSVTAPQKSNNIVLSRVIIFCLFDDFRLFDSPSVLDHRTQSHAIKSCHPSVNHSLSLINPGFL